MYDGYAALSPRRPLPELDQPSSSTGLFALVARIEQAITEETAAIRAEPAYDIAASNIRKSRHLYDLTRALKGQTPGTMPGSTQAALARLRQTLDMNQTVIAAHLAAVSEVATLIKGAIQRSETDGTYSETQFGRGI